MKRQKIDWKAFARDLREMREGAELGLREAARDLKISPATWSRAEHGRPVTVPIFLHLCGWLTVNPRQYLA